ncbi:hypothetical protein SAT01_20280 [Sinomonas atrocyanea]|nr:hypothetical protein SAT01_20280 [Sinomonas atrocyanea]
MLLEAGSEPVGGHVSADLLAATHRVFGGTGGVDPLHLLAVLAEGEDREEPEADSVGDGLFDGGDVSGLLGIQRGSPCR